MQLSAIGLCLERSPEVSWSPTALGARGQVRSPALPQAPSHFRFLSLGAWLQHREVRRKGYWSLFWLEHSGMEMGVGEQHSWGVTQFQTGRSKGLRTGRPQPGAAGLRLGSVISSCRHLPLPWAGAGGWASTQARGRRVARGEGVRGRAHREPGHLHGTFC